MLTIKRRLLLSHLAVILLGAGALGALHVLVGVGSDAEAVAQRLLDNVRLVESGLDVNSTSAHSAIAPIPRRANASSRDCGTWSTSIPISRAPIVVEPLGDSPRVLADERRRRPRGRRFPAHRGNRDAAQRHRPRVGQQHSQCRERTLELTAFSPVGVEPHTYIVGVRLDADSLQRSLNLLRLSTLGAILFGVLLAFVLSRLLAERLQRRIRLLGERTRALAAGEPSPTDQPPIGDEFDRVIADFDATAQRLREASAEREQALAALTQANAQLESRVAERTQAIEDATYQLKAEIESRLQVEALLAEAALTDGLTGLLNRRAMLEMLAQAVMASRGNGGFSMILADVDHFKHINDRYGHGIGDEVLAAVARELEQVQGDNRHAARWGGEEFFIVLPGTFADGCLPARPRNCARASSAWSRRCADCA